MSTITKLTAAALAVAAFAPAAGFAAQDSNDLRGAPQMRVVSSKAVTVSFVTDRKISAENPRVVVADHGTAVERAIKADGKHGNDFRYVARVKVRRPMEVGKKYTVRFAIGGEQTVERLVVLKAKR